MSTTGAASSDLPSPPEEDAEDAGRRCGWELRLDKWDGSTSKIVPLEPLDVDGHGRWFRWPAGTSMCRPSRTSVRRDDDQIVLVPHRGAWVARWSLEDLHELYCDVTTAPVVTGTVVRAVDLDLDVVRFRTGRVALVDEDQFEQRRTLLGYPPGLVADARATSRWLLDAVRGGDEPFASTGAARLAPLSTAARARVLRRLVDRQGDEPVPVDVVARWVEEAVAGFGHASVRAFLPVLVERSVRRRLGASADPGTRPAPVAR